MDNHLKEARVKNLHALKREFLAKAETLKTQAEIYNQLAIREGAE